MILNQEVLKNVKAKKILMLDISESFDNGREFYVEAGVGIGKSLAYLIPGILKSRSCGKPLIVCSSTIQLTEQSRGCKFGFQLT